MTCIIVEIKPENRSKPVQVRAHIRGHSLTRDFAWNKSPRENAFTTVMAFRDQFLPGKELGLCKELGRSKYKFPILS